MPDPRREAPAAATDHAQAVMDALTPPSMSVSTHRAAKAEKGLAALDALLAEIDRLREALERIADPPLGPTTTHWLIERRGGKAPGQYAEWLMTDGRWTTGAYSAAMFPTRATAEGYIAETNTEDVFAVEHGFMSLSMDVPEEVRAFARAVLAGDEVAA